ncbi:MAG TPA: cytochrome P450 [Tepidiformaceae bacterium]|nr:cytochrome P450 [Tepidiformaceae bacterium]
MTAPTLRPQDINLNDADLFMRNEAHDILKVLRQQDPLHWNDGGDTWNGFWSVTRYEDVMYISRNPELFISSKGIAGPSVKMEALANMDFAEQQQNLGGNASIITMDPPRHVKMRRLVNKGFTPRAVNAMEPEIRRITNEILDTIAKKGEADFVLEVASQLPLAVICGMMGIEQKDWPLMFDLTNKVLGGGDPEYQTDVPEEERGTPEAARQTAMLGFGTMLGYFRDVLEDRRANPREDDLVSILLEAEVDGEKLTEADILAFCFLLIVAGNETTRNAISGGLQVLSEHPEQKAKLLANPELMDSAVEEILRWTSPLHHMSRTATADVELRGKTIREGDRVIMWYLSVNRDEDIFDDPYTFDITRTPNDHLAFGIGEHFCLGAGFARKELRVMFEELFRRFPDIEMSGPPERLRSNFINGIKHLPVRFTPEN